jgi:hypothetical protein
MLPSVTFAGWIFVPIIGGLLTAWGFFCLLYLIPRTQKNPNVRTDVSAVKASYWAIVVGLASTGAWLLSAIILRSMAILRATQALR